MVKQKWMIGWTLCKGCGRPILVGEDHTASLHHARRRIDIDPSGQGKLLTCKCGKTDRYYADEYRFVVEDQVREIFRQAKENRQYAEAHWDEIARAHPDKMVAISGGKVIAAHTPEELMAMIDAKKWPRETVLVLNMSTEARIH